jgi:hypothetical protein
LRVTARGKARPIPTRVAAGRESFNTEGFSPSPEQESLPLYQSFSAFVHDVKERGEDLLGVLIGLDQASSLKMRVKLAMPYRGK